MRAERFGSYSIEATVAGMPNLSRLKSMIRSLRLCPPPRCQMVRSPELRRPPVRCLGSVSGLYGRFVVRSSLTVVVVNRRVGVTGLEVLIAMSLLVSHYPGLKPLPSLRDSHQLSTPPSTPLAIRAGLS